MQFDRLQTKTAFLLSFRCFCTLRKVSKKGSQNPEIGNFAGADFKRRMRRLQFPRAAFDFPPAEIGRLRMQKNVQFCDEMGNFDKYTLQNSSLHSTVRCSWSKIARCKSGCYEIRSF